MAPTSWRKKTGCCQESMSRPGEYVATGKYVATGSMSRQAVSRDRCRDKQYVATSVATSKLCRDKKALSRPKCCRMLHSFGQRRQFPPPFLYPFVWPTLFHFSFSYFLNPFYDIIHHMASCEPWDSIPTHG